MFIWFLFAKDYDGSHIKGLVINFIDKMFPSLLDIPGFLLEFITPIIKVYMNVLQERETCILVCLH